MKNKHTPGQWMVAGRDQNGSIDIIADGLFIAEAIGGLADGEQEANARLIAAAPDLLEALVALFNDYKDAGFWNLENVPEGKQALAAIAKARGEA